MVYRRTCWFFSSSGVTSQSPVGSAEEVLASLSEERRSPSLSITVSCGNRVTNVLQVLQHMALTVECISFLRNSTWPIQTQELRDRKVLACRHFVATHSRTHGANHPRSHTSHHLSVTPRRTPRRLVFDMTPTILTFITGLLFCMRNSWKWSGWGLTMSVCGELLCRMVSWSMKMSSGRSIR